MKYLTTYLDDEINFKFGNNGSIIELKAVDDHAVMSFSNEEKLLIRIKNEESYIKTVPVTAERKIIQLPTKLLKDLTVGQYDVELWQGEGDDQVIYPDEGFLRLKIHGNASQIDGSLISSITLADFEKRFEELANKIEEKIKNLPDVNENVNVDVKVTDGHLIINGKDTGVDLTAHDGKNGADGHTPVITVSDKGSLIIDGVDTNKSLIGPKGADGADGQNGKDGQPGKSAYQVAVDNGFDGTQDEWLRSLHGEDGIDGKPGANGKDGQPGHDGKSAYETWLDAGNKGSEKDFVSAIKGGTGEKGDDGQTPVFAAGVVTLTDSDSAPIMKLVKIQDKYNAYRIDLSIPSNMSNKNVKTANGEFAKRIPTAFRLMRAEHNDNYLLFDNGVEIHWTDNFINDTFCELIQNWLTKGNEFRAAMANAKSVNYEGWKNCYVKHPYQDIAKYDFNNAHFTVQEENVTDGERNMIKVWVETGLFADGDLSFCHVKIGGSE